MPQLSAESAPARRSTSGTPALSPLRTALNAVGSLWLTVAILFVLVIILLWGTVVANKYGDAAARFSIYGLWFNALGLLLGVNSAASLVQRWPWKRQQLGFTLPHLGLVVLLIGCFISRRYGVDATVSIIEGQSSSRAYQGIRQNVEMGGAQRFKLHVVSTDKDNDDGTLIDVPFTSGPFNWDDFNNGNLSLLPWAVDHQDQWLGRALLVLERFTWGQPWYQGIRDRGIIYDQDGIRLEVLDYLSNSLPTEKPGGDPQPLPFNKEPSYRLRQAKVRLTVDDTSDEFWIPGATFDPEEMLNVQKFSPGEIQEALRENVMPDRFYRAVTGRGRRVVLGFEPQSFRLGFSVHLNKAWQKLDPGAPGEARKSEYASEIDLLPNLSEDEVSASAAGGPPRFKDLRVTLNAPLDFRDPRSGQSFRMFQASMSPAFQPQQFGIPLGEPVYVSGLALNNDPGRGLTYVGCLMVVAGIFVAYFVRIPPARRKGAE